MDKFLAFVRFTKNLYLALFSGNFADCDNDANKTFLVTKVN